MIGWKDDITKYEDDPSSPTLLANPHDHILFYIVAPGARTYAQLWFRAHHVRDCKGHGLLRPSLTRKFTGWCGESGT